MESFVWPVLPEPTASMIPAIEIGDIFLINGIVFKNNPPQQGDVLVFNYPHDIEKAFVKRVIAVENDTVLIKEGKVYVNGKAPQDDIIRNNYYSNEGQYGAVGQEIKIPKGKYYVLGDKTQKSKDSRYWGFVGDEHIIGKAYKIVYPFERSGVIK
ncbi:MAG: signal peptidase I [Candidatus Omnitrophica bacterium]|nr:signal peptidase I [Candidatus Omnitrophota bacterium]